MTGFVGAGHARRDQDVEGDSNVESGTREITVVHGIQSWLCGQPSVRSVRDNFGGRSRAERRNTSPPFVSALMTGTKSRTSMSA